MAVDDGVTWEAWTANEVQATVDAYFRMLRMQELGQKFVKAEITRELSKQLPARNSRAIEYKFRNISAVLNQSGVQAVSGYKPLPNIQRMLIEVVAANLANDKVLDEAAIRSVETAAEIPAISDFSGFVIETPRPRYQVNERTAAEIQRTAIKRDYLERESRNRSLGGAGELLVMEYEARRLYDEGAKKLAERIERVSTSKGDGLGYDILSFDSDGRERYIEVKTTAYDAETPFFITPNEVSFSAENPEQFQLYRLFAFRRKPQMFTLPGPVAANCLLDPVSFRATLIGE